MLTAEKMTKKNVLYLCAGLQSSGSTIISWCFLQRHDMNGFLDANNDILNDISKNIGNPFTWYKTTISPFRMSELILHYQELGWEVRPLLVIRDPRYVWNSLVNKKYGRNGTTAEDPPLRMRMRRFKEDWEMFRANHWPILRYENFVIDPEKVLRETCSALMLLWDENMLTWPKDIREISDTRHGNLTFNRNRSHQLEIVKSEKPLQYILSEDLNWLENEFKEFNEVNHYPLHEKVLASELEKNVRLMPHFSLTRRKEWNLRKKPFRWMVSRVRRLIGVSA